MGLGRWIPWITLVASLMVPGGQWYTPYAIAGIVVAGSMLSAALTEDINTSTTPSALEKGIKANTCSTQEYIKVLYGTRRIGGNDVYRGVSGGNNDIFWVVMTLSEGECDSIAQVDNVDQVFLGDLLYNQYGGIISLVNAVYRWQASGSGTNEFYCELVAGGDPDLNEPSGIKINDQLADKGTIGSLAAGEWGWGDNDTLGFDTLYVRLADGNDPDTKESGYIKTAGNVIYWFHAGTSSQTVDTNLNTALEEWTDTLRNTAYIVFKLVYDRNYFQTLPKRQIVLKGRKLYDFRDASTAYSANPVLVLYDYMTNTRYGLGIAAAKFDTGVGSSWRAAADYCDTKSWECNLLITDQQAQDILDTICAHFRGELVWWDGKYYLRYADLNDESSCMTLTDEHIAQDPETGKALISISQPTAFQKPDGLRVTIIDPDRDYVSDDILIGDAAGVIKSLKLLGATRQQAADLGVYFLERQQLDRTISGTFRDDAIKLEPHDIITLNTTALAISDQLMRVIEANIRQDGLIDLVLQYEQLSLYDDDYNFDAEGTYQCTLPDPTAEPPSVSNVAKTEETYNYRLRTFTRLKVTFDPPASYAWFSHVEVRLSFDDSTWKYLYDVTTDFTIDPVEEGVTYYIRLKVVSIWGTKQQDSNDYKLSKTILGYTSDPASLTSLAAVVNANCVNLYAAKVSDPDIELYEFRLGTSWSGAIFLAALRSPNLSLYGVKPGNHTFYANTLSNNAGYGATPRSASVSLLDPPDGWAVQNTETCDYNGVGTHDNTEHTTYDSDDYLKCSHTAGVLVGTYTSPIYDRGASARYMVYVLASIVVTGAGTTWGDIIPSPDTWPNIGITTRTWAEIFSLAAGPSVTMKLKYGETSPPTNEVEKMEILSAIVTGRYFQLEITITDPSDAVNALVENFTMKFCQ